MGVDMSEPKDAAVGDGECAPAQVVERERIGARLFRERGDFALELGERLAVRVADDRHHEPTFGADGDANVVVLLVHDFVAPNLSV